MTPADLPSLGCPVCGYGCGCCCHCVCQTPCPTPDDDGDCFCEAHCHGGHPLAECHDWSSRYANRKTLIAATEAHS